MTDRRHHDIFDAIPGHAGPRRENFLLDYAGAEFPGFWDQRPHVEAWPGFVAGKPVFDEEYFEWIDLLESVRAAGDNFVMLELGAGFGRWGIRGGCAARKKGVAHTDLRFCEGEPQHVEWLREALELNCLSDAASIYPWALSYGGGSVPFLVSHGENNALNWKGQGIGWGAEEETGDTYFGKPVYRNAQGYGQIFVDTMKLEDMTGDLERIDLIDMDLQGAELDLARNAMATLNAKVKRVHIGTHSHEIEAELRDIFRASGWRNVWDFACLGVNETPYGPIRFVDGVQGWMNPRLSP